MALPAWRLLSHHHQDERRHRHNRDSAALPCSDQPAATMGARRAHARRQRRGGHFRVDFPHEDPALNGLHTVLRPGSVPVFEAWS